MVFFPKSSSSSTHKGRSLQGSKTPVNNSAQRRNSTNSHNSKALSPPHNNSHQEPTSSSNKKSSSSSNNNNNGETRKLERALSEPADRRTGEQASASRYKTELCRPFEENGSCRYGDKCQFAHGVKEIRPMSRHPKYKTELCRSFHTTGLCSYGPRCHFIHNNDKTKAPLTPTVSTMPPPLNILPPGRPKALSSSSLGSAGDMSPPSSHSGSPTMLKSSEDYFQFPSPSAYPYTSEYPTTPPGNINVQSSFMDYTTHEFNPDYYDTPSIFQERLLSSVFGSPVTAPPDSALEFDPTSICGSPTMDVFQQAVSTPSAVETSFIAFPLMGNRNTELRSPPFFN